MSQYSWNDNDSNLSIDDDEMEDHERMWLEKYKKVLKQKMSDDIDYRYKESIKQVNEAITEILQKYSQLNKLLISPNTNNDDIPTITMDIQNIKNTLWRKVDDWNGAQYKDSDDWSAYRKRQDGWYSRHKFTMFGDHFFNPLLRNSIPQLIFSLIHYDPNDPLSAAGYQLLFTAVLLRLIHVEIPQKKTKFLPLIPAQTYLANSCKKTIQQYLKQIGDIHRKPFNNSKFVKYQIYTK